MANFDISFSASAIVIGGGSNSGLEYFEYRAIKSVGRSLHADGNWYVIINFLANDVLNPLKLNLAQITNQATWTNDSAGSYQAVFDIQRFIDSSINSVSINSPIGSHVADDSVSVAIATDQFTQRIYPIIIVSLGETSTLIPNDVRSISFASCGTADALVTFDAGDTIVALPTGTTVNMDAGGLNNYYAGNSFGYDTVTNTGAKLIITYNI
jgi:hypothetical protein